jgi:hypothetical protein
MQPVMCENFRTKQLSVKKIEKNTITLSEAKGILALKAVSIGNLVYQAVRAGLFWQ